MRTITVVALVTALLVPATAGAKEGIELSSTPGGLTAGAPWDVDIRAIPPNRGLPATHGIGIQITNQAGGEQRSFPAARNGDGSYRVHVVFPSASRWDYEVVGLGPYHQQDWAPVDIAAPPAAATGNSASGSFPWAWVGGGAGLLAFAAVAVARFRPWRSSPSGPSVDPPPSSS